MNRMTESEILDAARAIIRQRKHRRGAVWSSPQQVREQLTVYCAPLQREVFGCAFLDNRHRLIESRELFAGTIDGASVHAREVVRVALELNAAACIFWHNHPSGEAEPSSADKALTARLQGALALIDVRVLDHVVLGDDAVSFAERGLL